MLPCSLSMEHKAISKRRVKVCMGTGLPFLLWYQHWAPHFCTCEMKRTVVSVLLWSGGSAEGPSSFPGLAQEQHIEEAPGHSVGIGRHIGSKCRVKVPALALRQMF